MPAGERKKKKTQLSLISLTESINHTPGQAPCSGGMCEVIWYILPLGFYVFVCWSVLILVLVEWRGKEKGKRVWSWVGRKMRRIWEEWEERRL